jgi:hypothetical protein
MGGNGHHAGSNQPLHDIVAADGARIDAVAGHYHALLSRGLFTSSVGGSSRSWGKKSVMVVPDAL